MYCFSNLLCHCIVFDLLQKLNCVRTSFPENTDDMLYDLASTGIDFLREITLRICICFRLVLVGVIVACICLLEQF